MRILISGVYVCLIEFQVFNLLTVSEELYRVWASGPSCKLCLKLLFLIIVKFLPSSPINVVLNKSEKRYWVMILLSTLCIWLY